MAKQKQKVTLKERAAAAYNTHKPAQGNIPALLNALLYELSRVRCILEDVVEVDEED